VQAGSHEERRQRQEADARLNAATRELERARERAQFARAALKKAEADVAAAEQELEKLKSTSA